MNAVGDVFSVSLICLVQVGSLACTPIKAEFLESSRLSNRSDQVRTG